MSSLFFAALRLCLLLTLVTGGLYPLLTTWLGQSFFAEQANGSLVSREGRVVGSALIGQPFTSAGYFWSRPSAVAYNGAGSGGSNQGPLNPQLGKAIADRIGRLGISANGVKVPVDLVTSSASGLDPHLSPAAIYFQIPRVAKARQLTEGQLRALIDGVIEPAPLGLLGRPVVNVLRLNLELDRLAAVQTAERP